MNTLTSSPPEICNFKAHFKLNEEVNPHIFFKRLGENIEGQTVQKLNFTLYRDPEYKKIVFTVFHGSRHVNVTGARSYSILEEAINRFNHQLGENVCISNVIVDNTTSVGRVWFGEKPFMDLCALEKNAKNNRDKWATTVSLRPDFFPGAVIRKDKCATIIAFSSGKFVIVGAKSSWAIQEAYQRLLALIHPTS